MPFAKLSRKANEDSGITAILARTAEFIGIRLESSVQGHHRTNWYNLLCLVYFAGGSLLNAHDLLFGCLRDDRRRRTIDLRPALGDSFVNRFQKRTLPEAFRPDQNGHSQQLRNFLDYVELASFEDEETGLEKEIFLR